MAANSCRRFCSIFWFPPLLSPPRHTRSKPFAQVTLDWTLRLQSQHSIFSCTTFFTECVKASRIVRFKGPQSLQQRRWWRGQEAALHEKAKQPAVGSYHHAWVCRQTGFICSVKQGHDGRQAILRWRLVEGHQLERGLTGLPLVESWHRSEWAEAGLSHNIPKSRLFFVPLFLYFNGKT